MTAQIEWIIGVVREGKEFDNYGDSYDFSGTLRVVGDKAELLGGSGKLHPGTRLAIERALEPYGLKLWWRRQKDIEL